MSSQDHNPSSESGFERQVFTALTDLGYRVVPPVKTGAYRIDMGCRRATRRGSRSSPTAMNITVVTGDRMTRRSLLAAVGCSAGSQQRRHVAWRGWQ
jgi:hypothetical protein